MSYEGLLVVFSRKPLKASSWPLKTAWIWSVSIRHGSSMKLVSIRYLECYFKVLKNSKIIVWIHIDVIYISVCFFIKKLLFILGCAKIQNHGFKMENNLDFNT
jgi:hypothetical protein